MPSPQRAGADAEPTVEGEQQPPARGLRVVLDRPAFDHVLQAGLVEADGLRVRRNGRGDVLAAADAARPDMRDAVPSRASPGSPGRTEQEQAFPGRTGSGSFSMCCFGIRGSL
ncbi:hypothetical protein ADK43_39955 [Streptomyces rimosus subsp. rimosus]|nr:hypothetical protein ADK43_39955 [Streptomyces rimosus subsp. rimosus]